MTEDSVCKALGFLYGIKYGCDCGPNIFMSGYRADGDWVHLEPPSNGYEADFLYITKSGYLYEIEVKLSIHDFKADLKKTSYHNFPDVKGFSYCVPAELYKFFKDDILDICEEKGAGLIVIATDSDSIRVIKRAKPRKDVKFLTDERYLHYLRLFAKKWVRKREEE